MYYSLSSLIIFFKRLMVEIDVLVFACIVFVLYPFKMRAISSRYCSLYFSMLLFEFFGLAISLIIYPKRFLRPNRDIPTKGYPNYYQKAMLICLSPYQVGQRCNSLPDDIGCILTRYLVY